MSEIAIDTQSPCIICGSRKPEIKGSRMEGHLRELHEMDVYRDEKLLKVSLEEYDKAKHRAIDRIIDWDFGPDNHCPVCTNQCNSIKTVLQHMRRNHFDYFITVYPKKCKECGKKFTRTDEMKRHYAKHFQLEQRWSEPEPYQPMRNPDAMLKAYDTDDDMSQAMSSMSIVFKRR